MWTSYNYNDLRSRAVQCPSDSAFAALLKVQTVGNWKLSVQKFSQFATSSYLFCSVVWWEVQSTVQAEVSGFSFVQDLLVLLLIRCAQIIISLSVAILLSPNCQRTAIYKTLLFRFSASCQIQQPDSAGGHRSFTTRCSRYVLQQGCHIRLPCCSVMPHKIGKS